MTREEVIGRMVFEFIGAREKFVVNLSRQRWIRQELESVIAMLTGTGWTEEKTPPQVDLRAVERLQAEARELWRDMLDMQRRFAMIGLRIPLPEKE